METYKNTLSTNVTLILSTDSDFLKYIKQSTPAKQSR
jgi:hypothetical protein